MILLFIRRHKKVLKRILGGILLYMFFILVSAGAMSGYDEKPFTDILLESFKCITAFFGTIALAVVGGKLLLDPN